MDSPRKSPRRKVITAKTQRSKSEALGKLGRARASSQPTPIKKSAPSATASKKPARASNPPKAANLKKAVDPDVPYRVRILGKATQSKKRKASEVDDTDVPLSQENKFASRLSTRYKIEALQDTEGTIRAWSGLSPHKSFNSGSTPHVRPSCICTDP